MSPHPIPTRPLTDSEKRLREKFMDALTGQSDLMDKLSERLLTLELAIPGLYATVLKLVRGDQATVLQNPALYITFGCWLIAMLLTLGAVIPKDWHVDTSILRQDPTKYAEGLGIEDFFEQAARHKRRFLIASSVLFFVGIVSAAYTF